MPDRTEKTLFERITDGDRQAEHELFLGFRERIQLMVRVRLRGAAVKEDAEDIMGEIQEAVLRKLRDGGFDPQRGTSLEAYTAGIAANLVAQHFRKRKNSRVVVSDDLVRDAPDQDDHLADLMTRERNAKLQHCLQRLKSKYREVLLMRIYEEKSIEEISEQLHIERRRVSERIHYAFKLVLRECKKDRYFQ